MQVTPRQKPKTPRLANSGTEVEELLTGLPVSSRRITRNGYYLRWHRERKKYIYEHRLVMEALLNRPVEPNEVVHHHDRDRLNNEPSNLELITGGTAAHAAHHKASGMGWGQARGTPRPWQAKPSRECPVCGKSFVPGRRTNSAGERVDVATCSESCGQTLRYQDRPHGANRYKTGCHCVVCRNGWAALQRERRARRRTNS